MNTEVASQNVSLFFDPAGWMAHHPVIGIWLGAISVWISLALIIRLWLLHPSESRLRRMLWTGVKM